eukprot:Gb_34431 [translate_table: standard]
MEENVSGDLQVVREVVSIPETPGIATPGSATPPLTPNGSNQISTAQSHANTPTSSRPTSALASPSMTRSPLIKTPRSPWTPLSPIGTPMKRILTNMKTYLEDLGHLTKLNPQDAWLPITESRNGNAYYSAFHNLNAGIGFQALVLPVAFTFLGWTWGILSLLVAYVWQLYTLWILTRLHESVPGRRYNRYVELAKASFGDKLGAWLSILPLVDLSAGTAIALILLPNLNSIAWLSLIGAVTAVTYCTMVWTLSISRPRPMGISYDRVKAKSDIATTFSMLNALGVIAFAFRGHNLALEIQATIPSSLKHPAYVPMWRGAKVAYLLIAFCLFPIAIGGYWAYGNFMPTEGILVTLFVFHYADIARGLLATTFLLVVLNCLSSFQIYSMPMFDAFESAYVSRTNKPCPWWIRSGFRVLFAFFTFFAGVALPFLTSLAGLLGGLTLPITFAYPCFMWVLIKKPKKYSFNWYLNWGLGILGILFSIAFTAGGIWSIIDTGLRLNFFKPN